MVCDAPGCERRAVGRKPWCNMHDHRMRAHGSLDAGRGFGAGAERVAEMRTLLALLGEGGLADHLIDVHLRRMPPLRQAA